MNGSCSIRDVGMGDACALASLHEKSFFDHWSTETFQALLTRPYVKAYGGTVGTGFDLQGFVLIQIIADEAEILTFCVAPDVRRRRMGGALLSVAERGAALLGVSRVFLEVGEENKAARGLYDQQGYVVVGRRSAYYRSPGQIGRASCRERV